MNMTEKELLQLLVYIIVLGWDYDRLSQSGQKTYNELRKLIEGAQQ